MFISLGNNCAPAFTLNDLCLRNKAYPFDWVRSNPKIIYDFLLDRGIKYIDFGNVISDQYELKDLHSYTIHSSFPKSHINYYGQYFGHYTHIPKHQLILKFKKYIDRFFNSLENEKRITFIHTTENYIYHKLSRDHADEYYDYLKKIERFLEAQYPNLEFKIINIEIGNARRNTKHIRNYDLPYDLPFCDYCENHNSTDKFFKLYRDNVTKKMKEIYQKEKNADPN